jgi:lauroyl/myristoyl acyltransferase/acyl carrier protein
LKRLDLIQDAVTLAETLPGGDRRLVAYLVPAAGRQPTVGELRERLRQSLPEHMLPAAFVWLTSLPRTATGKPDRKSLPSPPRTRPQLESPLVVARNATESALAGVWQDLLRLEQVGVQDNFFELGGDSLLSVQMILEAERILKVRIPTAYFQRPTIAHLVEIGARGETEQGSPPAEPRPRRKGKRSRNPFQRSTRLRSLLRKARSGRMTPLRVWHGIRRVLSDSALAVFDGFYRRVVFRMTYTRGRHWLSRWARSPLVSRLLYREPYKLFCRLVADMEDCTVDPDRAFNTSVEGNILNLSGGRALSEDESVELIDRLRASPHLFWSSLARLIDESPVDELDRHFSVTGLEYLQAAHRSGRGVIIVTYHNTSNRLAIAALPRRLDGKHIPTISQKIARQRSPNWQKNRSKKLPPADKAALYAVIALQGEHLLEEGRIIQFVSDNEYSRLEGYPVILAGRCYNLRPGFAELAVNTGAIVIPQYTGIRSGGQIHTTFLPPLDPGEGNREAQVRSLVDQYARFINAAWRIAPDSLRWPRIKKHFRQPPA